MLEQLLLKERKFVYFVYHVYFAYHTCIYPVIDPLKDVIVDLQLMCVL